MHSFSAISTYMVLSLVGSTASAQVSAKYDEIIDPLTKYVAVSADDMSADGRWVLGVIDTTGDMFGDKGYRWDRLNDVFTIFDIGIIPTGNASVIAISDDGQVILGNIPGPPGEEQTSQAAIWTEADGWTGLGWLPNAGSCPSRSDGYELSADGTIATGLSWDVCSARAFKWTEATGMLELENLANGGNRGSVMSADGSVIAGFAQGNSRIPAMWNGNTLEGELLDPTFATQGEFQGISDDGSVLLGSWSMGQSYDEAGKIVDGVASKIGAGSLLPGWSGIGMDIADNGTIVGFDIILGNRRSWIQPFGEGDLQLTLDYIRDLGADVPQGIRLEVLQAISTDGKSIVGHSFFAPAFLITLEYACPADMNDDGQLDFFDISAFLTAFSAMDPSADFNEDSMFDFFDISAFLTAFSAGCP